MDKQVQVNLRQQGSLPILEFVGEMTTIAEDSIQAAYRQINLGGYNQIALDFAKCGYINSAGIATLIGMVTQARRAGHQLFAYGLTPHHQKIFRMVGLADYMLICDSEADVLARLKP